MTSDPRDRLTQGANRARFALEARRSVASVPPLVFALVVTLVGGMLLYSQLTPTLFKSTREARFEIADAYGILQNVDEVRFRGVAAGTIKEIERDGTQLVLRTSLRKDYPVYRDARVELQPETPLNDMYLDIVDPGTPKAGELGDAALPEAQTSSSVKINDVLNTLRSTERVRLGQLMHNLGNGLRDRGDALRAAIAEFAPFVRSAGPIAEALADREAMTKRLVRNASILTNELGRRETQVRTLVREGSATLGTLEAGSTDFDATLRELPATFAEVNTSFTALSGVLDNVDGAVSRLKPVADQLPESLTALRDLSRDLRPAAERLRRPVALLTPFADALSPVARDLAGATRALRPQVPVFDKVSRALVRCEDAVINFFQWNASLTKYNDARGPFPRGSVGLVGEPAGADGVRRPAKNYCPRGQTIGGRPAIKADEG